ncbi:quercetin dioxygenase-like cupin family protein [Rhizomicrobium palustre]|uniref:Quercetin dioxygenase-like cupin family protein n=1 Tax=Rhizomicrobium palustre TaxID=189966 RepID=A0A846MVU8_9PROT|nr:hypothetical protein [Rhizomicrobium palustre]NIK87202.1 quercetin dioxygenase-like cupin family protein [Rhizomicrobium palustre]
MSNVAALDSYLDALAGGEPVTGFDWDSLSWREALPRVAAALKRPMKIERAEEIEAVFKRYLKSSFAAGLSGADAAFVAEASKTAGFVSKFKPYGIKCATALGYSIFFLHPGMGFSFQRHRTRKTELFHMLDILDRGQIYLSTSKEWDAVYEKDAFNRWLSGEENAGYQAYSRRPSPGDVYLVTELDTVHSVLGCVIEEFATVSTDMVDRLHDQNEAARGDVPMEKPETVARWLSELPRPLPSNCWKSLSDAPAPLPTKTGSGTKEIVLADTGEFLAERFEIAPSASLSLPADGDRARSLFCLGGHCRVTLTAPGESQGSDVTLAPGEVIIVAPNLKLTMTAEDQVSLSSHTIRPALALD